MKVTEHWTLCNQILTNHLAIMHPFVLLALDNCSSILHCINKFTIQWTCTSINFAHNSCKSHCTPSGHGWMSCSHCFWVTLRTVYHQWDREQLQHWPTKGLWWGPGCHIVTWNNTLWTVIYFLSSLTVQALRLLRWYKRDCL